MNNCPANKNLNDFFLNAYFKKMECFPKGNLVNNK
jgi:hypothetical protein